MKTRLITFLIVVLTSATAFADLNPLKAAITADQAANADVYKAMDELRNQAQLMDAKKRGPIAVVGPMLEAIGPEVRLALADDMLKDQPFGGDSATVRRGWRVGILHALGRSRDTQFRDLYVHVMRTESDSDVVRAASSAMGKLLDDEAANSLIALASADSNNAPAILAGMGTCRRASVAKYLASRLNTATSDTEVLAITLALRDVANSWAWKTKLVSASGEGEATKSAAAAALVQALAKSPAHESELIKALLIVNANVTTSQIQRAMKSATADGHARLKRAQSRLTKNPLN